MTTSILSLILVCITLNTIAQVALKIGMTALGVFDVSAASFVELAGKIFVSPLIVLGLGCYGFSAFLWMICLSRCDVSYAYALTSLGYVLTAIVGYYCLGESLSFSRILGIGVILVGVFLVARS